MSETILLSDPIADDIEDIQCLQYDIDRCQQTLDLLIEEEEDLLMVEAGRGAEAQLAVMTLAKVHFQMHLEWYRNELAELTK